MQKGISRITPYLKLLRPAQWIKNLFIAAPLLFSGHFTQYAAVIKTIETFIFFCLASSSTYIINDIQDLEQDRLHPKKRLRPLPSGSVSLGGAMLLLCVLYLLLIIGFFVIPSTMLVILAYIALNFAYSYQLKHVPIIDIFTIATGFVLRVFAGAVAINVPLSPWMFITTLSLALFLAAVKRQQEYTYLSEARTRNVLTLYNESVLRHYAMMSAVCSIVFYSLFVLVSNHDLIATIPVVLFGIFRYWLIVEVHGKGESPSDALYKDVPLLVTGIVWVLISVFALWPHAL